MWIYVKIHCAYNETFRIKGPIFEKLPSLPMFIEYSCVTLTVEYLVSHILQVSHFITQSFAIN